MTSPPQRVWQVGSGHRAKSTWALGHRMMGLQALPHNAPFPCGASSPPGRSWLAPSQVGPAILSQCRAGLVTVVHAAAYSWSSALALGLEDPQIACWISLPTAALSTPGGAWASACQAVLWLPQAGGLQLSAGCQVVPCPTPPPTHTHIRRGLSTSGGQQDPAPTSWLLPCC